MPSWSDKLYKADLNFATSGNNTVITGVAGKRIAIDFVAIRVGGSSTTTIQLKDGSTAYGGSYEMAGHEALVFENTFRNHDGVITLSEGQSFVVNSSDAVQVSGFARYRMLDNS